jgi:hypothetical protein
MHPRLPRLRNLFLTATALLALGVARVAAGPEGGTVVGGAATITGQGSAPPLFAENTTIACIILIRQPAHMDCCCSLVAAYNVIADMSEKPCSGWDQTSFAAPSRSLLLGLQFLRPRILDLDLVQCRSSAR